MKRTKSEKFATALYVFVILSFILPLGFIVYYTFSPPDPSIPWAHSQSEYTLMLFQSLVGIFGIQIPFLLKKCHVEIPPVMRILYYIFLFASIFLGETLDFYFVVPHWDDILHASSGAIICLFGFMLVSILNNKSEARLNLSPIFVAFFAFAFSMTIGAFWEIYEFTFDGVLGINMQKFMLSDGTLLVGRAALTDSMIDLIVDAVGSLAAAIYGYISLKRGRGWLNSYIRK